MQLKLAIEGAVPSTTEYSIVVTCNKCAGLHEMGILITMEDGPAAKQSIGKLYDGKTLPKSLENLTNTSISCPQDRETVYAEKPPPNLFSSNYERLPQTPPQIRCSHEYKVLTLRLWLRFAACSWLGSIDHLHACFPGVVNLA
jgi:hypothetical protein